MWRIAFFVCLSLFSESPVQDKTYPFRERADLELSSTKGYAVVKAEQESVARGTPYAIEIEFHNAGEGRQFYNLFFNRGIPLAAQLAIFDSEKRYLGDLLYRKQISRKSIEPSDWTYIPSGSYVGIKLDLMGANILNPKYGDKIQLLEAGTYYIQMIFYRAFVWPNLFDAGKDKMELYKNFDNEEQFRSNVIRIQFVDI